MTLNDAGGKRDKQNLTVCVISNYFNQMKLYKQHSKFIFFLNISWSSANINYARRRIKSLSTVGKILIKTCCKQTVRNVLSPICKQVLKKLSPKSKYTRRIENVPSERHDKLTAFLMHWLTRKLTEFQRRRIRKV